MLPAGGCGPFEVLFLKAVLIIFVFQFHTAGPANVSAFAHGGEIQPPEMLCGSSAALATIVV